MNNRRFIALGDLIADCYYNGNKLLGIDGGSSRFNVIANLSHMGCQTSVFGGCGNDEVGKNILKRFADIGVDISQVSLRDKPTRAYHLILNQGTLPKVTYTCSKYSPINGESTWYEDDINYIPYYQSQVMSTDVIVLDMLDDLSLSIIDKFNCDKVLDIGNTNRLECLNDEQMAKLIKQIEILQLNERVVPYLLERFNWTSILDLQNHFQSNLMLVTYGKNGADFIYNNNIRHKEIINSAKELDATGAGDAFFSVVIKNYYDNQKQITNEFVDNTFNEAVNLTSKVVQSPGARGHIYEARLRNVSEKIIRIMNSRIEH